MTKPDRPGRVSRPAGADRRRAQFVFVAFGRGVVLDHAPRWWERIWLTISLLVRRRARPTDDVLGPLLPPGPDADGPAGAGGRIPRRPPNTPLAGAIALSESQARQSRADRMVVLGK